MRGKPDGQVFGHIHMPLAAFLRDFRSDCYAAQSRLMPQTNPCLKVFCEISMSRRCLKAQTRHDIAVEDGLSLGIVRRYEASMTWVDTLALHVSIQKLTTLACCATDCCQESYRSGAPTGSRTPLARMKTWSPDR